MKGEAVKTTTQLRNLINRGSVDAMGCYDALSGRLAEMAGFEAIHLGGMAVEAAHLGVPDFGLLSMTELAEVAARLSSAVSIPILADVDTGFGGVLQVARTIREMERAGVAGVHIEDQTFPKHNGLTGGQKLVSRAEAVDRVKAALDARTDPDFIIAARSNADFVSFEEVVERSNLFIEAGADMAMPILSTCFSLPPDQQMTLLRRLAAEIEGPVMWMGAPPPLGYTTADLHDAGYSFVMIATSALSAAANAVAALFKEVSETGTDTQYFLSNPGKYCGTLDLMKAVQLDEYMESWSRYPTSL